LLRDTLPILVISPQANFGLDVGASVTLFNDVLILSGNYNVPAQTVRVGAEANIGALGVGLFRAMPQNGAANHVAIARFSESSTGTHFVYAPTTRVVHIVAANSDVAAQNPE